MPSLEHPCTCTTDCGTSTDCGCRTGQCECTTDCSCASGCRHHPAIAWIAGAVTGATLTAAVLLAVQHRHQITSLAARSPRLTALASLASATRR